MHKISVTDDGILIDMTYTHTFQERCDAACQEVIFTRDELLARGLPISMETIRSAALRKFYYFKDKYISLNNDYSMSVKSKIQSFIDNALNAIPGASATIPSIGEPEDILDDDVILLRWKDFEITSRYTNSDATLARNQANNDKRAFEVFEQKSKHLPRGVPIAPTTFRDIAGGEQFSVWKKKSFILPAHKEGRTQYFTIPQNQNEGDED